MTDAAPPRLSTDSRFGPRLVAGSRSHERARAILEGAYYQATLDGQLGFNLARLVLCTAFLLREVSLHHDLVLAGHPGTVTAVVLLAVGAVWSLVYRVVVRTPSARWLFFGSVAGIVLDGVLIVLVLLAIVLWPHGTYRGLLAHPWVYAVPVILVGAGLRFHPLLVGFASVIMPAAVMLPLMIDMRVNAGVIQYSAGDVVFMALLLGVSVIVAAVFRRRTQDLAERVARRAFEAAFAREKLGRYLGDAVAAEAMSFDEIQLGGARRDVAVLFSDLRGFTSAGEMIPPEHLVEQLNAYLDEMVKSIEGEGGVVDKYLGDGIMAVFGAPLPRDDDAARALRAARSMQTALQRHNAARALKGLAPLEHGIGIHFGTAIAGHVGTPAHAQYTVVGDVVNVASRIEQLTKEHHKSLLVSGELITRAGAAQQSSVLRVGHVEVRGRVQQIELFSVDG